MSKSFFPTSLRIYNSLTKSIDTLCHKNEHALNWYVCGPTVYDHAHIGHARAYMLVDVMKRIMEKYEPRLRIRLLMGITDVDDKIINKANSNGQTIDKVSREYEKDFVDCLEALKIVKPERFTRVSEHIEEIIAFCNELKSKNIAYPTSDGSLYFSSSEFNRSGFKYPKFRPKVEPLPDPLGQDKNTIKKNHRDFVLWKGRKDEKEASWQSPWGLGRPGWHIECSAMIHSVFKDAIDLHSGGIDLEFPHHENEIAQSEAFYGSSPWCPHFIHTGHLNVKNEKMSKSLGNYITIKDLLSKYQAEDFRFLCLTSHYRDQLDFTEEKLSEASKRLNSLTRMIKSLCIEAKCGDNIATKMRPWDVDALQRVDKFKVFKDQSLTTDFNVPLVMRSLLSDTEGEFGELLKIVTNSDKSKFHPLVKSAILEELQSTMSLFGLETNYERKEMMMPNVKKETLLLEKFSHFRDQVRMTSLNQIQNAKVKTKLLELCDQMRLELLENNITVIDTSSSEAVKN